MREVEVLVRVHDDYDKVYALLEKRAMLEKEVQIHDVYLMDPARTNLTPDKTGGLTEALRIREMEGGHTLTHKIDHFDTVGKWTYSDEEEMEISSAHSAIAIFQRLGFQELVTVDMEKVYFKTSSYTITLERVHNLGLFLEVEAHPTEERDASTVRKEIVQFIRSLGFNTSDDVEIGKPELLLKKKR